MPHIIIRIFLQQGLEAGRQLVRFSQERGPEGFFRCVAAQLKTRSGPSHEDTWEEDHVEER
jgi:hypothetical protein